jgi:hypothetical protein
LRSVASVALCPPRPSQSLRDVPPKSYSLSVCRLPPPEIDVECRADGTEDCACYFRSVTPCVHSIRRGSSAVHCFWKNGLPSFVTVRVITMWNVVASARMLLSPTTTYLPSSRSIA